MLIGVAVAAVLATVTAMCIVVYDLTKRFDQLIKPLGKTEIYCAAKMERNDKDLHTHTVRHEVPKSNRVE